MIDKIVLPKYGDVYNLYIELEKIADKVNELVDAVNSIRLSIECD